MDTPPFAASGPRAPHGPLVLADISGYTHFLHAVTEAHRDDAFADGAIPPAYTVVSTLLDGIVRALVPPFTLAKLEGDAVFAFAPALDGLPRGRALLDCLAACHAAFRAQLGQGESMWTCSCDACARITHLDLKFVLHAGPFVMQPMGGATELVGSEVVMAHRLLKTDAATLVDGGAYALVSDAAARRLDVPTEEARPMTATVEHLPPIGVHVFPLA